MGKELSLGTLFKGSVDASFTSAINELKRILGGLNDSLNATGEAAKAQKAKGMALGTEFTALQLKAGQLTSMNEKLGKAFGTLAERMGVTTETASSSLARGLLRTEEAIQRHDRALTTAGKNTGEFAKHADRAGIYLAEQQKILKFTKDGIENYTSSVKEAGKATEVVGGVLSRMAGTLRSMAYWGTAATLVYGAINAFKAGIGAIIEFDQAMKNLQAITGSTNAEVIVMGKTILNLSKNTRYSAVEIAEGMTLLAQAGLTATESIEAMNAAAILAQGTLSGMKEITDLLTTVMEAYRMKATDTGRIADVMAIAMNKSKLDVQKLQVAFSYLAPAASAAGLSLEETAAATSLLANAGLRASTIGTSFRQVLSRLISPNEQLRTSFINSGADMSKLNPLTNSLKDILVELTRVVPTASKAFELFGLRAAPAIIQLTRAVKDGSHEYDEMLQSMYDVGAAAAMAQKQMEGLGSRTRAAGNAAVAFGIALGKGGLGDVIGALADVLKTAMLAMASLVTTVGGQYLLAITSATAATLGFVKVLQLLGVGTLLTSLATNFGSVSMAVFTLKYAMYSLFTMISNHPILALATVVVGLIASFATWTKHIKEAGGEQMALAIETRRTEERLLALRGELQNSGKESNEYKRALKELGNEFKELAPLIDMVTGKWIDEASGLRILNELIVKNHSQALAKAVESLTAYKREYDMIVGRADEGLFADSIGAWFTKLRSGKDVLSDLEIAIRSIVPALKDMGITAESSLKDISNSLLIINPDLSKHKAQEAATAILEVLKKMQADKKRLDEEAAEEERKREDMLARGVLKEVPLVYAEMYDDLRGQRRADSEEIVKKLKDDTDKIKEDIAERSLSYQAGYGKIIAAEIEAIEKLANIHGKGIETQAQIDETILNGVRRLYKKIGAEYYNDRRTAAIEAEKKYAQAKGNQKAILAAYDEFTTALAQLDLRYTSQSEAMWADLVNNNIKVTKEGRAQLEAEMSQPPTLKGMDAGIPQPQQTYSPFGAVTDASQLALAEANVTQMISLLTRYKAGVHDWAGEVARAYKEASDAEKIELGTQMDIAYKTVNQSLSSAQIAKAAAGRAQQAMKQYKDWRDAENKAELETTRKFQADNREVLADSVKGEDPRVVAIRKYEDKIKEHQETVRDQIQLLTDYWDDMIAQSKKGESVKVVDIEVTEFKTNKDAIQYYQEQSDKILEDKAKAHKNNLEKLELEAQNKILALKRKELDFQKGVIKDQEEIKLEAAQRELAVDQWANEERLKAITQGGLTEEEIVQRAAEYKITIQQNTTKKLEKLELDRQKAAVQADKAHLSQLSESTVGYEKTWNDLQENLTRIHELALEERALNEKFGMEIIKDVEGRELKLIEEAYAKHELAKTQIKEKAHKKRLKEIQDDVDNQIAALQAAAYARQIDTFDQIQGTEQRLQAEVTYSQDMLKIYMDIYPQIKQLRKDNEMTEEEFRDHLKKTLEAAAAERRAREQHYQELHRYDEEYYKQGKITAEEYSNHLDKLEEQMVLSHKERLEKRIEMEGTFFERLKLGWEQAQAEATTWGETIVRIGRESAEQLASGLTSALKSFADGTKTAAQAWQDFARSFLWWIAEMIMKQMFLNALMGGKGGSSGGFTDILGGLMGLLGVGGDSGNDIGLLHGGGIIGKEATDLRSLPLSIFKNAKKAHKGTIIGSNEEPIIGKKGEGVFTEEQMKAMSPAGGEQKVEIFNIVDPRLIDAYLATPRGKRAILNVVGQSQGAFRRMARA